MIWFLILSLTVAVLSRKNANEIPIVKTSSKNYYLEMRIGGPHKPRVLFYLDFNSTEFYLDGSLFPELATKTNHSLQVLTPRNANLGTMKFTVLPANMSWVQYKGVVGLGLNSTFLLMLEKTYNKEIGLRAELVSRAMVIEGHACRNPQVGPFKVSFTSWTTLSYLTPLSFNFRPTQDFLALLNATHNNFKMDGVDYHENRIQVSCADQERSVKIKRLIECWSMDSSDKYECNVNVSSTPDVGLTIFSLPVKICKNGVDIGITVVSTQSYFNYFAIIAAVNMFVGLVFLNRKKIGSWFSSDSHHPHSTQSLAEQ